MRISKYIVPTQKEDPSDAVAGSNKLMVRAGGYVFYNDGSGGGLVSAKTDQAATIEWITGGSTQSTLNDNTNAATGTGLANSNAIIAQADHATSAAQVCLAYDDGTYSDWFLPSIDELNLMYTRLELGGFGGFTLSRYWSSTEYGSGSSWTYNFSTGSPEFWSKGSAAGRYVRAVRAF